MKTYSDIFAATKLARETLLSASASNSGDLKKTVTKILVAMVRAGDCKDGELKEHAMKITGRNIKNDFQGIYELVAVFSAVVDGKIAITELEFDNMESSKLALLSPFLSKDELADKLVDAVEKAKTGTAKDIRDLKPKKAKNPPAEGDGDKNKPTPGGIPVQFAVLDLADPAHPLLTSRQVQERIRTDAGNDPSFHAVFLLRFAAKVLRDHPEISEVVAAQAGEQVAEIFDLLTTSVDGKIVEIERLGDSKVPAAA